MMAGMLGIQKATGILPEQQVGDYLHLLATQHPHHHLPDEKCVKKDEWENGAK